VLTLTATAADTVRQLLASARASAEPHPGVRVSTARRGRADTSVEVTLVAEPEAMDQKIDEAGARVFVDETAAEFLDDKILDASVEARGVRFTILNPRSAPPGQTDRPN
jgi:iron-sulfur cluster assembly protein